MCYCCPEHQKADWKNHKKVCKQLKADRDKMRRQGKPTMDNSELDPMMAAMMAGGEGEGEEGCIVS